MAVASYDYQSYTKPKYGLTVDFSWNIKEQSVENNTTTIEWNISTSWIYSGTSVPAGGNWKAQIRVGTAYNYSYNQVIPIAFSSSQTNQYTGEFTVTHDESGKYYLQLYVNIYLENEQLFNSYPEYKSDFVSTTYKYDLPTITQIPRLVDAPNFNDEESPIITYSNYTPDSIESLQACISLTGGNDDILYRNIPIGSGANNQYTFNLTDDERAILRQAIGYQEIYHTVRFYVKSVIDGITYWSYLDRTLKLVNYLPTLTPVVRDVNTTTVNLTGNNKKFIKYYSDILFESAATARKEATIAEQHVTCGSKAVDHASTGTLYAIDGDTVYFNVVDSRGFANNQQIVLDFINYIKPTCYIRQLSLSSDGRLSFTIYGNYFNGSFGAVNNSLSFKVGYSRDGGSTTWQSFSASPTSDGNTYTLTSSITGLVYTSEYTVTFEVTDALATTQSLHKKVGSVSIFDWGKNDFNFNVPVNIEAETLQMAGDTVVKHTPDTILAAANNRTIYLRPNGADSTTGQVTVNSNGVLNTSTLSASNVTASSISTSSLAINNNTVADYIIARGTASMGTNGTWSWAKWASGKAECWGCRNYGGMAITTAWGNLYRSEAFAQDLPSGVFARTPDVININLVSCDFGGWICLHESTTPSATTTGGFIVVSPASATTSMTYIGFHIIGEWS